MSYVVFQKNLLSEDLKQLISSITGHEEGTDEFAAFEKNAWSIIMHYNCPSLDKNRIKSRLYGFVEKFRIHAYSFPQKAKNLEMLFKQYIELAGYEEEVLWNMLNLLLLLSRRPTESKDDDKPITFPLCTPELEEETFDWVAYLKQDLPEYRLPSSDDSLSEEEDEEEVKDRHLRNTKEAIYQASREIERQRLANLTAASYPYHTTGPSTSSMSSALTRTTFANTRTMEDTVRERTITKEELKAALLAKETYTRSYAQWWTDPNFREIPVSKMPVPNACFTWEQKMSIRGVNLGDTRVLSEAKAMKELLWILARPTSYYIIKKNQHGYKPREKVSISSTNPVDFSNILSEICPYLSIIERLNDFIRAIESAPVGVNMCSSVPWTFVAYADALKHVLNVFKNTLSIIEAYINKQDNIYMIGSLLLEVRPWLIHLKYIYNVHIRAVPEDWCNQENWLNASRLLIILFNSLDLATGWEKVDLTVIFLKTFRPYVEILETWLVHSKCTDYQDEFLIKRPSRIACEGNLIVRDYKGKLFYLNVQNTLFLDNFVYYSIRACSSVDFQIVLQKNSFEKGLDLDSITENSTVDSNVNPFYVEFLNSLLNDIQEECIVNEKSFVPGEKLVTNKIKCLKSSCGDMEQPSETLFKQFNCVPDGWNGERFVVRDNTLTSAFNFMTQSPKRNANVTKVNMLLSKIEKIDSDSTDIGRFIQKNFNIVITERMQPKGFARDTLLNDHKILEHIGLLKGVYLFLNGVTMTIFIKTLFSKVVENSLKSISWTNELRELLYADSPVYSSNFIISMPSVNIRMRNIDAPKWRHIDASYPDFIEFSRQITINYLVEPPLNLVITSESLEKYNELFNLLLQAKWATYCLYKLSFKDLPAESGVSLSSRLISLRMFLLHNVSTFEKYFLSINSEDFDSEITHVCSVARDIHVIATAHDKILNQRRKHCFLLGSPKILECIQTLFKCCQSMTSIWKLLQVKHLMHEINTALSNFELQYQDCINELAEDLLQLGKDHNFTNNVNFNYLCDEIFHNMPGNWE